MRHHRCRDQIDHEILSDTDAHRYYCAQYGNDRAVAAEVCAPSWLPTNHRRLLRALAKHERKHDDAMMAYCHAVFTA